MFLGALVSLSVAPAIWRNYEYVEGVDYHNGRLVVSTRGGNLERGSDGIFRPSALQVAASRKVEFRGTRVVLDEFSSRLGGLPDAETLPALGQALASDGKNLIAGTIGGLYELRGRTWTRIQLPSQLPGDRPQALEFSSGKYIVGGIDGLYTGTPGHWTRVRDVAVKSLINWQGAIWALMSDGSVSKLDLKRNALATDVLYGSFKRPWTASISVQPTVLLFGGHGGWGEKFSSGKIAETYLPQLDGDIVTAVVASGDVRWVATQKSGLLRVRKGKVEHVWNPGTGLSDTWVTALVKTSRGLIVGTASSGLFLVKNDQIASLPSPTKSIRTMAFYGGGLIVGGLEGAWRQTSAGWAPLPTDSEETTFIRGGTSLAIGTPSRIIFLY